MADLVTHWALAVLVKAGVGWRDVPLFVAGSLLPDLLARLPPMALELAARPLGGLPAWASYMWAPLHLPAGMLVVSYLLAMLFAEERRRVVFANLVAGMGLHLLVDLCQDHLGVGYLLGFPLGGPPVEFGLWGSEDTVVVAPVLAAAAAWVWWRRRRAG